MMGNDTIQGGTMAGSRALPGLERPFKVWVQPTRMCNLDCVLCYDDCNATDRPRELSDDELIGLTERLVNGGVISLFFEGASRYSAQVLSMSYANAVNGHLCSSEPTGRWSTTPWPACLKRPVSARSV